ncbi:MAG: putative toxin-antitoxin system toxin component, PIN family [Chloroflexota bacterium]
MRVAVDTNVLVAALRSPNGASRVILQQLAQQRFEAVASVAMMLEYEAVLKRPEHLEVFKLTLEEVEMFLNGLAKLVVPITPFFLWRPMLKDPADEHVLEAAVNGFADAIVTFNLNDFGPAQRFGLEVIRPNLFLQRIRNG